MAIARDKIRVGQGQRKAFHFYLILLLDLEKNIHTALTSVVQLVGGCSAQQRTPQGTCRGCRPGLRLEVCERQPTDVSLPLFVPPFPSF